jgi:hypothetical protein
MGSPAARTETTKGRAASARPFVVASSQLTIECPSVAGAPEYIDSIASA